MNFLKANRLALFIFTALGVSLTPYTTWHYNLNRASQSATICDPNFFTQWHKNVDILSSFKEELEAAESKALAQTKLAISQTVEPSTETQKKLVKSIAKKRNEFIKKAAKTYKSTNRFLSKEIAWRKKQTILQEYKINMCQEGLDKMLRAKDEFETFQSQYDSLVINFDSLSQKAAELAFDKQAATELNKEIKSANLTSKKALGKFSSSARRASNYAFTYTLKTIAIVACVVLVLTGLQILLDPQPVSNNYMITDMANNRNYKVTQPSWSGSRSPNSNYYF